MVDKILVTCPECKRQHAEFVPYGYVVNIRFCLHCDKHFRLQAIGDDKHTFVISRCAHQPQISKGGEPHKKEKPRFATGGFTTGKEKIYGFQAMMEQIMRDGWGEYFDAQNEPHYRMNPNAKRKNF